MKVSICMITYNHEKYIAQAIQSVLDQVTSFDYTLIIGEDQSPDKTRQICLRYQDDFPGKIIVLPNDNNLGMLKNSVRTMKACSGAYVAFIEGDDYWTDALKLQKQVDFLEANPDFSVCFHNVLISSSRNNSLNEWVFHKDLEKNIFKTEDLLSAWFIPSASVMFVNYPDFIFPDWFFHCKSGDIPFLLLLSLNGKLKYLNEVMGVYRLHDNGISSTHIGYDKIIAMTFIYQSFNIHTNYKYKDMIREAVIYEISHHIPKEISNSGEEEMKKSFTEKLAIKIKQFSRLKNSK